MNFLPDEQKNISKKIIIKEECWSTGVGIPKFRFFNFIVLACPSWEGVSQFMIQRYFLIFYLQLLKIFLQIRKSSIFLLLNIQKNIFLHQLFLRLLAPFSWHKRTALLEFLGKYQKVVDRCHKRLLTNKKNEPYLYEIIARNYRNLNKLDAALTYIHDARRCHYNTGSIDYEHGLIFFMKKNYLNAKRLFELAIEKGYNTAPLQIHLGKVYYQLGLLDKAERCFRRVLELYPTEGSIYFLLAMVLKSKLLYDEAELAFLKAIKYGSDHKEEHLGLAEIYTKRGFWAKAIREYKMIKKIDPKSFVAHYFLGLIYEIQGKDSDAIQELILANKINPNDEDTKEKLTKLLVSAPQI